MTITYGGNQDIRKYVQYQQVQQIDHILKQILLHYVEMNIVPFFTQSTYQFLVYFLT